MRKQRNIELNLGHKPVSPIMAQSLTKTQMSIILEHKKELRFHLFEMFNGMPVTMNETNMMLLNQNVFVTMESGTNIVQVRGYYRDKKTTELLPKAAGMYFPPAITFNHRCLDVPPAFHITFIFYLCSCTSLCFQVSP